MSIVLPFIEREVPQVLRLLDHMVQLSGQLDRTVYLLPFKGLDVDDIKKAARKAFADVQVIQDGEGVSSDWRNDDKIRDAAGPNSLFRQAAWFFHFKPALGPWLWLEPDCVPLTKNWDDEMETAYRASGKSIMGVAMKWKHSQTEYLNGAAVYPQNLIAIAPAMVTRTMWQQFPEMEIGFDVAGGAGVVRQAHITDLIQLDYRSAEPKPRTGAVLFHGDRSGKLIETLSGAAPRPESGRGEKVGRPTKRPAQNVSKRRKGGDVEWPGSTREHNGAEKVLTSFAANYFDAGPVAIGGTGLHGIKCTCVERDFPCPFHFRDNENVTVGDQIRAHVGALVALATNQNRKTRTRDILLRELRKAKLIPRRR